MGTNTQPSGFTSISQTVNGPQNALTPGQAQALSLSGVPVPSTQNGTLFLPAFATNLKEALPLAYKAVQSARGGAHTMFAQMRNSTGVGYQGATDKYTKSRALCPSNVLCKRLRALGVATYNQNIVGDNGVSLAPASQTAAIYDARFSIPAGATVASLAGPGRNAFVNSANANPWAFNCDVLVDTAMGMYVTNNTVLADLTLDVGGSALVTMAGNNAGAPIASAFRFTAPTSLGKASNYTINVKNPSGTGGNFFQGVIAWNAAEGGISVLNIGFAGMTSTQMAASGSAWNMLPTIAPMVAAGVSLFIIGEGINDGIAGTSTATHTANLTAVINAIKSAGADVILVGDPASDFSVVSKTVQDSYRSADRALAAATGIPYIDPIPVLGQNDGSTAQNLIYADTTGHLTPYGSALLGQIIGDALVGGMA